MKFEPYPYQQYAIDRILAQPEIALFLDMGLGKTVCTLTALAELMHDRFESCRVLVIAPLRVAEHTWPAEIEKWDHLRYLKPALVLGSKKKRLAALAAQADIWIINRENVDWLVKHYGKDWPFDTVVIDELSSFKSTRADRFRALRRVRPYIKRIIGLTGTPAPNGLIDLWPQIYLLDQGQRLGRTVSWYRESFFYPEASDGHIVYKWGLRPGAEAEIHSRLQDLCISMRATDWLDLPERVTVKQTVYLTPAARAVYKQMERDLVLLFEEGAVTAANAAVLTGKLLQIANGAVYNEDRGVQVLHDEKLAALRDLVEEAAGQPVLVFYQYQHDLERIQKSFSHTRTLKTARDIEEWNAGTILLLLAHPASAGHGLNLQAGGHIVVWFGLPWSLELYQQANARLHRQGQAESVIVHHLVAENTIDEDVLKALERKETGQNALLEAVKARIMKGVAA